MLTRPKSFQRILCPRFLSASLTNQNSWNPNQYTNDLIIKYSSKNLCLHDIFIRNHTMENIALYSGPNQQQYSYREMDNESYKLFNLLKSIGVTKGTRVAVLLPKCKNLMISAIAIWRLGAVYVPLFTAFGPDAIGVRVEDAQVCVIISDEVNSPKLETIRKNIPMHLVMTSTNDGDHHMKSSYQESFWIDTSRSPRDCPQKYFSDDPSHIQSSDPIALLYTSGTTGSPKGVVIPAFSLASFHMYMQYGLGLECGDDASSIPSWINPHIRGTPHNDNAISDELRYQRYYSSADTGWAYGFYYNLIGPMLLGIPMTDPAVGAFSPLNLLKLLSQCQVTHFASSPSAYRSLRAFDLEEQERKVPSSFDRFPTPSLTYSSSAGEPLSSTLNSWWISRMTLPLADHYGQSELGMLVNCHWGDCLLPGQSPHSLTATYPIGTMGHAMPGYRCTTLSPEEVEIFPGRQQHEKNFSGQLAIDISSSPLYWFQGYLNQPHRTAKCHSKSQQYYLTGDLVHQGQNPDDDLTVPAAVGRQEESSLFWYISRNDDIITSSGYRIGPSDIERCLLKDTRVKDVGVYGVKDPEGLRGEIIVASVVLHRSFEFDHEEVAVTVELQKFIGENLSKHCKPKKILYRTVDLPRTPSGKIQRFKLKDEFHLIHKSPDKVAE